MKNAFLTLAAALLLLSPAVAAPSSTPSTPSEVPSYSYVQGGWASVDSDPASDTGNGPMLDVSWGVTDLVHLVGSYEDVDYDLADASTMQVGAGVHHTMSQGFDLLGEASYVDMEMDMPVGSASENGFAVSGGARKLFGRSWEANGSVEYVDVGDADDTLFGVNALYTLKDRYALGAGYKVGDTDTVHFGFRVSFGRR